jgi:SagB-type dehydrogenase family enzyme
LRTADIGSDTSLWWAVDPILMQPTAGKVRLMSPKVDKRIVVASDVAQLMLAAQDGIAKADGGVALGWAAGRYASVTNLLATYGYLVDGVEAPDAPAPWQHWGPVAWAYHMSLTHPGAHGTSARVAPEQEAATRPSSFRDFGDAPILLLPRLSPRGDMRFIDVLERRRTHRRYVPAPVGLEELSDLLRYTFGPLRFADAGDLGVMQLRAAASGGARHETEAYVYVFDVDHVAPGLYVYDSLRHGLVSIRPGLFREELDALTYHQGPALSAAFGVVTVAQSDRMSWKYRDASAYRVLWQNVGCMAQIFSLMCASLNLGTSMTGAIQMEAAHAALGLRTASELVTFAMCCGHPALREDGQPMAVDTPNTPFRP